jgi:hypothetical protein
VQLPVGNPGIGVYDEDQVLEETDVELALA